MKFLKAKVTKSSQIWGLLVFMALIFRPIASSIDEVKSHNHITNELFGNDIKGDEISTEERLNDISDNLVDFIDALQIEQKNCLELFKEHLKKYKPNAPWITEFFMDMDLEDFSIAFKYVVKILTVPHKRWFYFSNDSKSFDPENYWVECLWQCMHYEQWASQLSIDENDLSEQLKSGQWKDKNSLNYKDADHPKVPFSKILTIIEKCGFGKNLMNKYYQFCAFYTDCLSHFFCQAVYACYGSMDEPSSYKLFLDAAKECLSRMKQNLIILKKSNFFYPNYKMTLDSYKKILSLLEAEKLKAKF